MNDTQLFPEEAVVYLRLPIMVKRADAWTGKKFARAHQASFEGVVATGASSATAKAALADQVTAIIRDIDEPEFLTLGPWTAILYFVPGGWGYRLMTPSGLRGSSGSYGNREDARRSAITTLTQDYTAHEGWFNEVGVEIAANFARDHGQDPDAVRKYAGFQRACCWAAALGETDVHSWVTSARQDEFLNRWDRPEKVSA